MKKKTQNIALVCCRSGSKGIKNKNLKKFNGKPILFWLVKNIKQSKIFHKVILSTDSNRIKKIGENLGMIVPGLRPRHLSHDNSDVFNTHKYIFKLLKLDEKNSNICIINNSPFIKSLYIKKTYELFKKNKFKKTVMLVKKVEKDQSYFRQSKLKKNIAFPIFSKDLINSKVNRQGQKNLFYNLGDVRWGRVPNLKNYKTFNKNLSKGYAYYRISKYEHIDINNEYEWRLAEKMFKFKII